MAGFFFRHTLESHFVNEGHYARKSGGAKGLIYLRQKDTLSAHSFTSEKWTREAEQRSRFPLSIASRKGRSVSEQSEHLKAILSTDMSSKPTQNSPDTWKPFCKSRRISHPNRLRTVLTRESHFGNIGGDLAVKKKYSKSQLFNRKYVRSSLDQIPPSDAPFLTPHETKFNPPYLDITFYKLAFRPWF